MPCCHFELRITTAQQVRRYGIEKISEVLDIVPVDLLRRNVRFAVVDPERLERLVSGLTLATRRLLARSLQDGEGTPTVRHLDQFCAQLWLDFAPEYGRRLVRHVMSGELLAMPRAN